MKRDSNRCARVAAALLAVLPAAGVSAEVLTNPTITAAADPFAPAYVADFVFDSARNEYATSGNNVGTPFSTDPNDGTWIEFDFGTPTTIDRFVNVTRGNTVDEIIDSRLVFSSDPVFDDTDSIVTFNLTGANAHGYIQSFAPQTAQYVRWEALSSSGLSPNLGAAEMRFLNTPAGQGIIQNVIAYNSAPEFSPQYTTANAVNGDAGIGHDPAGGVEYASASQGVAMFVDFDLGLPQEVIAFDYFDRLSETEDVSGFDLIFSDDPSFTNVIETKSYPDPEADGYTTSRMFDAPVTAQYVRLQATAEDGNAFHNTGVAEMIFYTTVPDEPWRVADVNGDGQVSVADVGILATNFGLTIEGGRSVGDLNLDGSVTVGDVGILATYFGQPGAGLESSAQFAAAAAAQPNLAGVVPEPATIGLVILALPLLAGRRGRRSKPTSVPC